MPSGCSRIFRLNDIREDLRARSQSERIRFYRAAADVQAAAQKLIDNLASTSNPKNLLSRHLPDQYRHFRARESMALR
ncbi:MULTISPECIES: class II D-tagatose-bisphosphate aldolase, non-catalytic subunit [unclassified Caballeronia]|uniref:class II D-tagatose-bisphosphate aldolase non-catalytic subunit n=1 Tax=unclassified Caballeronia TaxID=2646786 RepID=UPI002028DF63|nr:MULTISPECIES: class II D-tagatose-bisphosphate aldolase, non-catalytic subunit [unclassified Caballeronia]